MSSASPSEIKNVASLPASKDPNLSSIPNIFAAFKVSDFIAML